MKKSFIDVQCREVVCFRKGEQASDFYPGDFILTHGSGLFADLIQLGQSLRFRGDDSRYAYWNHAALIINPEGDLIEALNLGVKQTNLNKYKPKEYCLVRIKADSTDRAQMVRFASSCLEDKYGWITIASISLSLLTGLKFSFGFDGEQICSGLVARSLERTNAIFDKNPTNIAPADLAKYYQVYGYDYYTRQVGVKQPMSTESIQNPQITPSTSQKQ